MTLDEHPDSINDALVSNEGPYAPFLALARAGEQQDAAGFLVQPVRVAEVADRTFPRPRFASGDGVEHDRRGICAGLLLDHFHTHALRPDIELLDCRRAKRIACRKQNFFALRFVIVRQFCNTRCLARAVCAGQYGDLAAKRKFCLERKGL